MDAGLAILSLVAMREGESWSQQHGGEVQTLCVFPVILPPQPSEAISVLVVPPPFFFQHLNQEALGLNRKELVTA